MAILNGDDLDNVIIGTSEDDEIQGMGGNDTLTGGIGNDTVDGGPGNDTLNGQGGDDELFGEDGEDILLAGSGFDIMTGGADKDIFGFNGTGHFEISDFNIDEDDCLFFDSEALGINNLEQLISLITDVEQTDDSVSIEFADNVASITLVGVNLDDITADLIIFNL